MGWHLLFPFDLFWIIPVGGSLLVPSSLPGPPPVRLLLQVVTVGSDQGRWFQSAVPLKKLVSLGWFQGVRKSGPFWGGGAYSCLFQLWWLPAFLGLWPRCSRLWLCDHTASSSPFFGHISLCLCQLEKKNSQPKSWELCFILWTFVGLPAREIASQPEKIAEEARKELKYIGVFATKGRK